MICLEAYLIYDWLWFLGHYCAYLGILLKGETLRDCFPNVIKFLWIPKSTINKVL